MKRLSADAEAVEDIDGAALWYESRRRGLGNQFLDDLDQILYRISHNPLQFPMVRSEVRRALLRKFPHSVYFLDGHENIEIVAVLHHARSPERLNDRL